VFLEALMYGLPCAAHEHPVMRWVLGEEGSLGDFSKAGSLTRILTDLLSRELTSEAMTRRRESVRKRFTWESLAPAYFEMFRKAARQSLR
jgi:glycosyltransferase involved in cell wall biosynthesis